MSISCLTDILTYVSIYIPIHGVHRDSTLQNLEEYSMDFMAVAPTHHWAHLVVARSKVSRTPLNNALVILEDLIDAAKESSAYAEFEWPKEGFFEDITTTAESINTLLTVNVSEWRKGRSLFIPSTDKNCAMAFYLQRAVCHNVISNEDAQAFMMCPSPVPTDPGSEFAFQLATTYEEFVADEKMVHASICENVEKMHKRQSA